VFCFSVVPVLVFAAARAPSLNRLG
jgi:hypothetical protein